jgi:flagellar biosynthetic protein FliR
MNPGFDYLMTFLLISLRLSGLLLTARVLGENLLSWSVKLPLLLVVSLLMLYTVPAVRFTSLAILALAAAGELLLGAAMGLVSSLIFYALATAGQLAALQTGLGFSNLVDPYNGENNSVLSHLLVLAGWMVVLAVDGHQILLRALAASFKQLPPGAAHLALGRAALEVPLAGARIFVGGVLVAAPVLAVVLLVNVGLALLARAAPQLHVLAVGFIVTIVLGVLALAFSLGSAGETIRREYLDTAGRLLSLCSIG